MPTSPRQAYFHPRALRLAYERVMRWTDGTAKDRPGLRAYRYDLDRALEELSTTLLGGDYKPQRPFKYFAIKAAGTQRTRTVLWVEDAIVYQAIANRIAERAYAKLRHHNDFVFGNVLHPNVARGTDLLEEDEPDLYFFTYWKGAFERFQSSVAETIAEPEVTHRFATDITGFYDAIPHHSLLRVLYEEFEVEPEILDFLEVCLNEWSGTKHLSTPGVGIPQGPIPSALFANMLLYQLDDQIANEAYRYYRYVDDIHIYGEDGAQLREVLVDIDVFLKGHGLSINTKKTSVEALSPEDEKTSRKELARARAIAATYFAEERVNPESVTLEVLSETTVSDDDGDEGSEITEPVGRSELKRLSGFVDQIGGESQGGASYAQWTKITAPDEIEAFWRKTAAEQSENLRKLFIAGETDAHGRAKLHPEATDVDFIAVGSELSRAVRGLRQIEAAYEPDEAEVDLWLAALYAFPHRTTQYFYSVATYSPSARTQAAVLEFASRHRKYESVRYEVYQYLLSKGSFSDSELRQLFKDLQAEESALVRSVQFNILFEHAQSHQLQRSTAKQLEREPNEYVRLLVADTRKMNEPGATITEDVLASVGI